MIASLPRLADVASVQPCPDGGILVIPHILPLRIPAEALPLTVAEWAGITGSDLVKAETGV